MSFQSLIVAVPLTPLFQAEDGTQYNQTGLLTNGKFDAEKYAEENYARTVEVLRRTGLQDTSEARKLHIPEARYGYLEYGDEKGAATPAETISAEAHAVNGTVIS